MTEEQMRDLMKECGLDWHKGYMPLFDGDHTNRFAILIEAAEQAGALAEREACAKLAELCDDAESAARFIRARTATGSATEGK